MKKIKIFVRKSLTGLSKCGIRGIMLHLQYNLFGLKGPQNLVGVAKRAFFSHKYLSGYAIKVFAMTVRVKKRLRYTLAEQSDNPLAKGFENILRCILVDFCCLPLCTINRL